MSAHTLSCEQAVFTSTRVPTGEGYRIIAASRGLRPDIKQTITRHSPSQDALCWSPDQSPGEEGLQRYAASFYAVPNDRLCVAYSCYAGDEHTGRGGQRVYTLNLVFKASDFHRCGYNPFTVLRAMVAAGITTPLLKPPPVLPSVELAIDESPGDVRLPDVSATFSPAWRCYVLSALFDTRRFVLDLPGYWLAAAESVMIGLPGERRADISFSAGIRFSVSRSFNLMVLSDDQGRAKTRIVGRPEELIEPEDQDAPDVIESQWLTFVSRHWQSGDTSTLARRTAITLGQISYDACERIGGMYNEIDGVRERRSKSLLDTAAVHLRHDEQDDETSIAAELVVASQDVLLSRFSVRSWDEVKDVWPNLCAISRQSTEGRLFARPLIERAMKMAGNAHPIVAAEAALDLAVGAGTNSASFAQADLIDRALTRLFEWAQGASAQERERLVSTCRRWRCVRPGCEIVAQLHERYGVESPVSAAV